MRNAIRLWMEEYWFYAIAFIIIVIVGLMVWIEGVKAASRSPTPEELVDAFQQYAGRPFEVTSPVTGRIYQLKVIGLEGRRGEPDLFNVIVRADRVR